MINLGGELRGDFIESGLSLGHPGCVPGLVTDFLCELGKTEAQNRKMTSLPVKQNKLYFPAFK